MHTEDRERRDRRELRGRVKIGKGEAERDKGGGEIEKETWDDIVGVGGDGQIQRDIERPVK